MKQLWQLNQHYNSFERNLLPSSRGNLDELRFLLTEILLGSVFDFVLLVLAPSQFFQFLWCLSSPLLLGVMWWDCGWFPDNGVARTNAVFWSMISKVTDLPQQDFIDVLEVVDTAGGIFFPCSSLPFFGGVGYLTKIHTKNRPADRVNSVTFTTSKLNNKKFLAILAKYPPPVDPTWETLIF